MNQQIQDEPKEFPCFTCNSTGRVDAYPSPEGIYVHGFRNGYLQALYTYAREVWMAQTKVCSDCKGTGRIPNGGLKS